MSLWLKIKNFFIVCCFCWNWGLAFDRCFINEFRMQWKMQFHKSAVLGATKNNQHFSLVALFGLCFLFLFCLQKNILSKRKKKIEEVIKNCFINSISSVLCISLYCFCCALFFCPLSASFVGECSAVKWYSKKSSG